MDTRFELGIKVACISWKQQNISEDLVEVQEVTLENGGPEPAVDYTVFYVFMSQLMIKAMT